MLELREHPEGALLEGRRRRVCALEEEPEKVRPLVVSVIVDQISGHLSHHVAHLASQTVRLVALHRDEHLLLQLGLLLGGQLQINV
jgi:hypothetical protein